MNILFFALELPYPPNDGGRIRTYNILKQVAKNHQVTLLTTTHSQPNPAGLEALHPFCQAVQVIQLPENLQTNSLKRFGNLARRYPISLEKYTSQDVKKSIKEILKTGDFDVVHVDQIFLAQHIDILNAFPTVLTHHNIETLLQRRNIVSRQGISGSRWLLSWLEYFRWVRYEKEISNRYDALVVVSQLEENYFKSNARRVPTFVVPNGVDTQFFTPIQAKKESHAMLYTGRMDYAPNVDAMIWFCGEVLPLIRQKLPDVTLTIVGRDPAPDVKALASIPGVTVTGVVEDVRPYFASASVYIVPLRQGGGTRLKILEAMSMELPVVSTRIGMEGLDLTDGKDIIIADTREAFQQKIVNLFEDRDSQATIGKAARYKVIEQYDWGSISACQEQAYEAALARFHKRGEK